MTDKATALVERPSPRKRPARYSARRGQIIAAATQVLNSGGTRGFSLAAVARVMDMHPVSLTYYFKTREKLAAECILETIRRFQVMIADAARAAAGSARTAAFIAGYFEVRRRVAMGEEPPLASFSELRLIDRSPQSLVIQAFGAMLHGFEGLLEDGLDARTRAIQARLLIEHLGWTRGWLDVYQPQEFPQVAKRLTDIVLNGLAASSEAWPTDPPNPLGSAPAGAVSRERYLIAATELINIYGYDGASVDLIAGSLNVTKGSFYHHNADKEELLEACFDRTLALFREAQVKARGDNAWRRLWSTATALMACQQGGENGRLLRNYALATLSTQKRQVMTARFRETAMRLAALISEGVADRSIRPVDPFVAAQVVMGVINASCNLDSFIEPQEGFGLLPLLGKPGLMGFARSH